MKLIIPFLIFLTLWIWYQDRLYRKDLQRKDAHIKDLELKLMSKNMDDYIRGKAPIPEDMEDKYEEVVGLEEVSPEEGLKILEENPGL